MNEEEISSHTMRFISYPLMSIEYEKGEFNLIKENNAIYTASFKPEKAPTQSIMIYNGTPEENPYERVLMRVKGEDGRSRILNPDKWPYSYHAQLSLYFSDGEYGGSGILVGPHHILTAGHNVYNCKTKEWAKRIVARLALNEKAAPFGEIPAIKIYTFEEWTEKENKNFDIALITFGYSIGLDVGWASMLADKDEVLEKEEVHVTGYPGDKGFNQLWTMSYQIKKFESERIFYDMDTYGGQSGGSVWITREESPYAIGVHTLGEGKSNEGNSGVRLSCEKLEIIKDWISETKTIKKGSTPKRLPKEDKKNKKNPIQKTTNAVKNTFSFNKSNENK